MSSKRRLRRNACDGKTRHATEQAARAAIGSLLRSAKSPIGYINAYRCEFCSGWHTGHARKASW